MSVEQSSDERGHRAALASRQGDVAEQRMAPQMIDDSADAVGDRKLGDMVVEQLSAGGNDTEACATNALIGLAIAIRMKRNNVSYTVGEKNETLAEILAVCIWEAVIKGELTVWKNIAREVDKSSDDDLKDMIRKSNLYAVMVAYGNYDADNGTFSLSGGVGAEQARLEKVLANFGGELDNAVGLAATLASKDSSGASEDDDGDGMDIEQQ